MKRILVPTDFSQLSEEAYKIALDIASKTGGEITLLHILYGAAGETLTNSASDVTTAEEEAQEELEKLKSQAAGLVSVNIEIAIGEIITTIKNIVEENDIDLVIVGTTGASGLYEIVIGSNTEKVVRHSPVPVLAIRTATDVKSIKNILLPSTLELDQPELMKKVKALQHFLGATLHLLYVNTPVRFKGYLELQKAFDDFGKHYQLGNYITHFRSYNTEEGGIIDFAQDEDIDLIVMGTHARKGLAHLFKGSITEDVVNHVQIPVWTYRLQNSDREVRASA